MSWEWKRFERVASSYLLPGKRLYRSSAPNYQDDGPDPKDATQRLTSTAVRCLVDLGINGIISLNEFPYKYSEKGLLNAFGIDYLHLPIRDYSTPTLDDMDDAYDFFLKHRSTLVHCGYGHGRTGTMITTLQLCCTDGRYPREYEWERNHVETLGQRQFLKSVVYDVGRWPKSKAVDYSDRYWKRGEDGKDEGRKGRRNERMKK